MGKFVDFELVNFTKEIVRETINELNRRGLLKDDQTIKYREASEILREYYKAHQVDNQVWEALGIIGGDQYYTIIPLYFLKNYTIEKIAEILNVEVSTVSRNKKRLCIQFYDIYSDIKNGNRL